MSFLDLLDQPLTRRRLALSPSGDGEFTSSPSDLAFMGRIRQLTQGEPLIGDRESAISTHRLYYPAGTALQSADLIIDGAGNVYDLGVPDNAHGRDEVGQADMRLKTDKVGA